MLPTARPETMAEISSMVAWFSTCGAACFPNRSRESPLPLAGEGGERMRAGRGLLWQHPSPPSHSLGTLSPLRGAKGPNRMSLSRRRLLRRARHLQATSLKRNARRLLLSLGQFQHRRPNASTNLPHQLLPVFRMRRRLLGRARAPEGLSHRIEAVADHLG